MNPGDSEYEESKKRYMREALGRRNAIQFMPHCASNNCAQGRKPCPTPEACGLAEPLAPLTLAEQVQFWFWPCLAVVVILGMAWAILS